jgi:hypothetical protein
MKDGLLLVIVGLALVKVGSRSETWNYCELPGSWVNQRAFGNFLVR